MQELCSAATPSVEQLEQANKAWLKRRSAIKPALGHLKSDRRMFICWLQCVLVDAIACLEIAAVLPPVAGNTAAISHYRNGQKVRLDFLRWLGCTI